MINTFIVNGKYSASNGDFIYYEAGNNSFCASISGEMVEVYYGNKNGGADFYELPLTAKDELLRICNNSVHNTRALMKYVRENDLNKEVEKKNGLGVKMKLTNENVFSLLAKFRRQAKKQGIDEVEVDNVIKEAKSGDYKNLLYVLSNNIS